MERTERLLNLLGALLDTERPLSRADIATRVPGYPRDEIAYRRAFERDKDTLRGMGVPLITEPLDPAYPDHGDGYRVPKDQYALPDPGLTRDEMDALALAASVVKLSDSATASAILKLGGEQLAAPQTVQLGEDDRLPLLFAARSERRSVTFDYREKARRFDPHRLSFRNGHWYVNGFDHDYEEMRTYRLDRMQGLQLTNTAQRSENATDAASPWLPSWQMGDEPLVDVRVLVDADQVQLTREQTGDDAVVELRDGGDAVFRFPVSNQQAFIGYIAGFLEHAEILEPPEVREQFLAYLQELAK